ncbi:MAG: hypothetical protein MUE73_02910 [Planctomycetes bacterium]|nr:hypothetical protein [Planctomycetota bacterium]
MRTMLGLSAILMFAALAIPGPARVARGAEDAPAGAAFAGDNGNRNGGADRILGDGLRRGWINLKRSRVLLDRSEGASDDNVLGWVEVRSDRLRERFRIHVMELTPGDAVRAELDDGSGTPIDLGERTADDRGVAMWDHDTLAGDALPGDVEKVSDLAGFAVTVYDAEGAALLGGEVPVFGSPRVKVSKTEATAEDGGHAWLRAQVRSRLGDLMKLLFRFGELEPGAAYAFFIEDPADSGEMVEARRFLADAKGRFRLQLTARDLTGLKYEVRNQAGEVVFSGQF